MLTKKHALDDDFESPRNVVTESNVDYLSYKFDEMDLAASWRVLTKQKLNIVNGIRLENASWRTWAKQRNNLKTVSPDTLNWLKDSDVTWLYGPLHTVIKNMDEEDRYAKPKVSTTEDTYGLMTSPAPIADKEQQENTVVQSTSEAVAESPSSLPQPAATAAAAVHAPSPQPPQRQQSAPAPSSSSSSQQQRPLKSALKKVTMSDLLKRSASELQINTNLSSGISISEANQQLGAFSPAVIASHRQPKLRFNQYVEQCIALPNNEINKKRTSRVRMSDLNDVMDDDEDEEEEGSTTEEDYDPDDSDAGSVIMMRSSSSSSSLPRPRKLRSSIKKIEPALLKTNSRSDHDSLDSDSSSDEDNSQIIMAMPSGSNSSSSRRRYQKKAATIDTETWEAESAESDAFVKHIIRVSKDKQQVTKDPAADRVPVANPATYETDGGDLLKSDYDYEFDDDDWDTHSEHMEDGPFAFTEDDYPPVSPPPPVGCQIAKAPVINDPVLPTVRPKIERSISDTKAADDIQHNQQHYSNQQNNASNSSSSSSSNSSSSSLFSSIAHWASSHLWPSDELKK